MNNPIIFVTGLLLSTVLLAQGRPARSVVALGGIEHSVNTAGQLNVVVATAAVQTGVVVPGASAGFGATSIIVGGRSSTGSGLLEHWKTDSSHNMVLQSSMSISGFDFVGVTYDETNALLYVLDLTSKSIWRVSWNGSAALPAFGSWAVWATPTDVPSLNNADSLSLSNLPGTPGYVYLISYPEAFDTSGELLSGSAGNIQVVTNDIDDLSLIPNVFADQLTASEGGTSVLVYAAPSTTVQVVDVDANTVLGSGTVASNANSVSVSLSSALVIGKQYVARQSGTSAWNACAFRAMRRYGFPETMTDGTAMRRIPYPHGAWIGSTNFDVSIGVSKDPAPSADGSFLAYLAFALRTTSDPITTDSNGNSVLVTSTFLDTKGWINATNGQGIIHGGFDIPNDSSLIGVVGLFQFWVADSTVWRLSEIVGIEVEGFDDGSSSSSMMSGSGAGSSMMSSSSNSSPSVTRAATWTSLAISRGQMHDDPSMLLRILNSRH